MPGSVLSINNSVSNRETRSLSGKPFCYCRGVGQGRKTVNLIPCGKSSTSHFQPRRSFRYLLG